VPLHEETAMVQIFWAQPTIGIPILITAAIIFGLLTESEWRPK